MQEVRQGLCGQVGVEVGTSLRASACVRQGALCREPSDPPIGRRGVWPWAWLPLFPSQGLCPAENPAACVVGAGLGCPCHGGGVRTRLGAARPSAPRRRGWEGGLCSSPSSFLTLAWTPRGSPAKACAGTRVASCRGAGCVRGLSFCRKGALFEGSLGTSRGAAVHRSVECGSLGYR